MFSFRYYWDKFILKLNKIFLIEDPRSSYKIYCYDEEDSQYSLSEVIYELKNSVKVLQEKIEKLEEENVETSNCLYEVMNSIEAVDARIDILTVQKWTDENV